MDRLRKLRRPERSAVTRIIGLLEVELKKTPIDSVEVEASLQMLEKHSQKLNEVDEKIKEALLDKEESTEEEYQTECDSIEDYMKKIAVARVKVNGALFPPAQPGSPTHSVASSASHSKRTFRLPKIELQKFNGELTEWLGWWAQFSKIDEDDELHQADKFTYLIQSMKAGTRAAELVNSYPPTTDNYPKVVKALQERYGNKKLLKQVYVRELIKMILDNRAKEKTPLSSLYDSLESSLRSLESLGVTMQQMVEFLFPMVESSLPEEILLAWQRSPNFGRDGSKETPPQSELDYLMTFLKTEIHNEEQRKLARSGFAATEKKSNPRKKEVELEESVPTAAGLFNGSSQKDSCIFCDKNHESRDCFKAQKMTLDDRKAILQKKGACFICLKTTHRAKNCKVQMKCAVCSWRHNILICPDLSQKAAQSSKPKQPTTTTMSNLNFCNEVLLRTLMIQVRNPVNPRKKKIVRAVLDCGSQRSYVLKKTARELGLVPVTSLHVSHDLFGGRAVSGINHKVYEVGVQSLDGEFKQTLTILDEGKIVGAVPTVTPGSWVSELRKNGVVLNDSDPTQSREIAILIGSDFLGPLLTGRIFQLENGLTATETMFGWAVFGPQEENRSLGLSVISMTISNFTISELWSLETLGIMDPAETKSREERERATQQHFLDTVCRNSTGRYCVSLPWKDEGMTLPSNREVAFKRLESTTKKLNSLSKFRDYDQVFNEWESEGFISTVTTGIAKLEKCHYLPHRAVFKESITTPVRPVFDASCKVGRSPSLNDCLERGPNLLELIPSILLRFRMGIIGVIADIRKAFLMIEIREEDRDFLRFLWWADQERKIPKTYRHNRVVFGMNCSPFLLNAVIGFHLAQMRNPHPQTVAALKNLYVDNLVVSVDCLQDYETVKKEAAEVLSQAQMDLRQWERNGVQGRNQETNVLGLKWDKLADVLFCVSIPNEIPEMITKRILLSQLQTIFDPLGFLSPMLIVPKVLLQRAWMENRKWDDELSEDLKREFLKWRTELSAVIEAIRLPRNCTDGVKNGDGQFQLHVFSDASKAAYATAVFLRVKSESGVTVQLLQSKTRVTPAKAVTIPRLELLSCTIAARLANAVKTALSMDETPIYFWTDSTTALAWIRRREEWGTFVGNRVKEICELTKVEEWHHVPGISNPADLPSRGVNPMKFAELRWWEGPKWLKEDPCDWPRSDCEIDETKVNQEKKKSTLILATTTVVTPWYLTTNSYSKNLRVMSRVFRFIDRLQKKNTEKTAVVTPVELKLTELRLFMLVQNEMFPEDESVISGLKVEKGYDGILRVKTKLLHREDSMDFKRPILLPNSHPLVDLYILDEHIYNSHGGAQFLMGALREKTWIIQGRRAIKKVIRSCVVCRRFEAKCSQVPVCSLPEDRVKDSTAFEVTGIDLAGPLTLKDKTKVWIVLFTCGVFRCVHLELVLTLTTEDFLMAFTRFCKRKRRPDVVYTDNGTNFVGAVNLFESIDWDAVQKRTQQMRIKWRFSPPSAPWWGGWWERLIRSVKDLLKRMLGFRKLSYAELETCLCEVESVVNHRPLTFVTEDPQDLTPLTPAMFIWNLPVAEVPESKVLTMVGLGARIKNMHQLFGEINDRFRKEYLGLLVQRGKENKTHQFQVGEIVLVEKDNAKRVLWPMARIKELIPGKDGVTRVVRLTTKTGEFLRPIQRLYPLEVSLEEFHPIVKEGKKLTKLKEKTAVPNIEERKSRIGRVIRQPAKFCDY